MKNKIISLLIGALLLILLFINNNIFISVLIIYFTYIMIVDYKKSEVEYLDVLNIFLISLFFVSKLKIFILLIYLVVVFLWFIIEFVIYRDSDELVMQMGIIDFFYIATFFSIFFINFINCDVFYFAGAQFLSVLISIGFYIFYKVIKKNKMIPYLFVMYPGMVLNILLLFKIN